MAKPESKGNKGKGKGGTATRPPDVLPIPRGIGGAGAHPTLHIVHQFAHNFAGGSIAAGAWRTRPLNAKLVDEIGSTLSSNQFTLPAGTFNVFAWAPAHATNRHKIRLRNVTDGTTALVGTSEFGNFSFDADQGSSFIIGRLTIAAGKTFELQHRVETTNTDGAGMGAENQFGAGNDNIYASIWIERIQ